MTVKVRPYTKSPQGGFEVDIRFDWPDGRAFRRRFRAPVNTEAQARRWGETKERVLYAAGADSEATRSKHGPPPDADTNIVPTLADFFPRFIREHCEANRHKPSGIDRKQNSFDVWIAPRLGAKRLDEIGTPDIIALKSALSTRSAKTANNVLTTLSACLKFAGPEGLRGSPGLGLISKVPRVPLLRVTAGDAAWYEAPEYARLVEGARRCGSSIHVMVLLGGDAGLRRGEILALKWTDLDLARRRILVKRAIWNGQEGVPKSGKGRIVTMTKDLHATLLKHKHLRGERVLYDDAGRMPTNKIVRMWLQRAQRMAGLEPTGRIHQLRHTFCSRLAAAGVPVGVIQALAGHASLSTTMRYMHLSPTSIEAAIDLLDRAPQARQFGETLEKVASA